MVTCYGSFLVHITYWCNIIGNRCRAQSKHRFLPGNNIYLNLILFLLFPLFKHTQLFSSFRYLTIIICSVTPSQCYANSTKTVSVSFSSTPLVILLALFTELFQTLYTSSFIFTLRDTLSPTHLLATAKPLHPLSYYFAFFNFSNTNHFSFYICTSALARFHLPVVLSTTCPLMIFRFNFPPYTREACSCFCAALCN